MLTTTASRLLETLRGAAALLLDLIGPEWRMAFRLAVLVFSAGCICGLFVLGFRWVAGL